MKNKATSVEFYEQRYSQGYMEEWPIEKKQKIVELIQSLQLPQKGEALDFGCGNGVLTEIVRQALPGWTIYGTDISETAINNAKSRYPMCTFFVLGDPAYQEKKFDLLFTHHVFEHVANLQETFDQMENYLKTKSSMLHFLPCGNEGSFEYNVCLLRKDGINTKLENRFFFEEEGHVRRLTTKQVCELCETKGFTLQKEYYSNHYYGAIEWITNCDFQFILMFTDTSTAIDEHAKRRLKKLRIFLLTIKALRLPANIVNRFLNNRKKTVKDCLLFIFALPFYILSKPIDSYWKKKTRQEWETKKTERNGSEMALYFSR
jgi:cyclopropane fatty-acyl-phospholipid synthase-like methyltransferase